MSVISFLFQFHFTQFFISVCTLYCRKYKSIYSRKLQSDPQSSYNVYQITAGCLRLMSELSRWFNLLAATCQIQSFVLIQFCLPITSLLWVEWYDNRCSCRAFATLLQGYVAMPPSQLVSNSYYDCRGFCCGFLPFVSVCCVTKIQCYIAVKWFFAHRTWIT